MPKSWKSSPGDWLWAGFAALLLAPAVQAQRPPLCLELDLGAGFVRLAGSRLAGSSVDKLTVRQWRPSVTLTLQPSTWFQVAGGLKSAMDLRLKEKWGFSTASQDALAVLDHQPGRIYFTEARFMPLRWPFCAAAGLLHARPTSYAMTITRTGPAMQLGQNSCAANAKAAWRPARHAAPALGFGFSQRRRGLGFSAGLTVPVRFPRSGPVSLTPDSGLAVAAADVQSAASVLQRERFYAPIAIHGALGWSV